MDIKILREKSQKWLGKYKYLVLVLLVGVGLMLIPSQKSKDAPQANAEAAYPETVSLSGELEKFFPILKAQGR